VVLVVESALHGGNVSQVPLVPLAGEQHEDSREQEDRSHKPQEKPVLPHTCSDERGSIEGQYSRGYNGDGAVCGGRHVRLAHRPTPAGKYYQRAIGHQTCIGQ
jgi:hypothetical protein